MLLVPVVVCLAVAAAHPPHALAGDPIQVGELDGDNRVRVEYLDHDNSETMFGRFLAQRSDTLFVRSGYLDRAFLLSGGVDRTSMWRYDGTRRETVYGGLAGGIALGLVGALLSRDETGTTKLLSIGGGFAVGAMIGGLIGSNHVTELWSPVDLGSGSYQVWMEPELEAGSEVATRVAARAVSGNSIYSLRPGDSVRLQFSSSEAEGGASAPELFGAVKSVQSNTVDIESAAAERPFLLGAANDPGLWVQSGSRNSVPRAMVYGTAAGGALGLLIGTIIDPGGTDFVPGQAAGIVLGAGIGLVTGIVVGALVRSEDWNQISVEDSRLQIVPSP